MNSPTLSPVEVSERLIGTIDSLQHLRAVSEAELEFHPQPDRWCIKQIIGHLVEEDTRDFAGRIRQMIEQHLPTLDLNDQDAVARSRTDCGKSLSVLLAEFIAVRRQSAMFVASLGKSDLDRGGGHPKLGTITVRELLHEWIYHDLNHLNQINRNLQGALWPHLGAMQGFYRETPQGTRPS